MKWICEICGLQVDDKRVPNDCKGIKGQRHEWEETWYVLKKIKIEEEKKQERERQEKERHEKEVWQNFLDSSEGKKWQTDFEKIKKTIEETVESVQRQYIQVLERGKENYIKIFKEINKKAEEYEVLTRENLLLKEKNIPLKKGIGIRLIIAGVGFWAIIIFFSYVPIAILFFLSIIVIPVIFRIKKNTSYQNQINLNNINLTKLSSELGMKNENIGFIQFTNTNDLRDKVLLEEKNYLKEIDKKYEAGINDIIQKSIQAIQENNSKYGVNKGLLYDSKLMYEKENPEDNKIREFYIKDKEFISMNSIGHKF